MPSVDIYWQDLTESKQEEIIRKFGDNGNYDIMPIATLGDPDDAIDEE